MIALRPLVDMEAGIQRQRLVVAALVTVGLVLLGVFSWVFVGRLLRPILENQQRQAQFVASASHELRTPLTAILSAASAMERAEDSQRPVFGQMIRREGQRMGRLIQDMLTLASADSHSWDLCCWGYFPGCLWGGCCGPFWKTSSARPSLSPVLPTSCAHP